jgi:hypothetical protein
VATLALERPRSSWLTKLSLTPAASATSRSVSRRSSRIARSRSPTSRPFDFGVAATVYSVI